mgnify:FL=1
MAVPKKRTGKSKQGHRRSNWKASKVEVTTCQNCGSLVPTHTVCTVCGTYKGKVVSIKADGFKEEVVVEEKVQEEVKEEENNVEASNSDEKEAE